MPFSLKNKKTVRGEVLFIRAESELCDEIAAYIKHRYASPRGKISRAVRQLLWEALDADRAKRGLEPRIQNRDLME